MWVIPKNHTLYSRYALDMVDLSKEFDSVMSTFKRCVMWRSKVSLSRTWLIRWKQVRWMSLLSGRILRPSERDRFEEELRYSLAGTPANRFQRRETVKEPKTPAISGPTYSELSETYGLKEYFLKTSMDTSLSDSNKSSETWKEQVTRRRGEYSARLKQALRTRESEYTSWATPNTMDYLPQRSEEALRRQATTTRKGRTRPANLREQVNSAAVRIYQENVPTPRASEYKDCGPVGSKSHKHMKDRFYLCAIAKDADMPDGKLNPTWVEWLMGVPTGWTELDYSEME